MLLAQIISQEAVKGSPGTSDIKVSVQSQESWVKHHEASKPGNCFIDTKPQILTTVPV